MSGQTSPFNGSYESASTELAMISVRKDLFPEATNSSSNSKDSSTLDDEAENLASAKLDTDYEQSIDEIAVHKRKTINGSMSPPSKPRHKKHKQSRREAERSSVNGLSSNTKKSKSSNRESKHRTPPIVHLQLQGGKNLSLVSSSEYQNEQDKGSDEDNVGGDSESSEDEVLKINVKLPVSVQRPSGKPYSHELSQLSTKKSKSKSKEHRTHVVTPCSGKPRSMMGIHSSRSKKKKKVETSPTYHSQLMDTNTIKIKIRKTRHSEPEPPTPIFIPEVVQKKPKKKRASTPEFSESSGEEYNPDVASVLSVAAPKSRHPPPKTRKSCSVKSKVKNEKTERSRVSTGRNKEQARQISGPQSPWAERIPEEILFMIFKELVSSSGCLPSVIRLGQVCKLWHSVSCRPELWRNVDLTKHTIGKFKTDFKLIWLMENRLSQCQVLNIAHWKACNVSWLLSGLRDHCPGLLELSVAGWNGLTPEHLYDMIAGLPLLQRLDLSLTSETGGSSTCLSASSVARIAENFGNRLTHLTLANNKFTALSQILSSIAAHCPNLEVLDISCAQATSHPAAVPLEALQKGCPKMRVFRAANAQLVLANATTMQQMEAGGWKCLEEVSIAGDAATERSGCGDYRLGDEALQRIVRSATRLRLLDLRGLQRLSDSGLVRVPAWDLQHLFLGGCNITRKSSSCLELLCQKWAHSLLELDLSWASAGAALDAAMTALADHRAACLRVLNLCGSSVSFEPVKNVLLKCPQIDSINLSSCRALPRGMKRLYTGKELQDLKDSFDPEKAKTKEIADEEKAKKKKGSKKNSKSNDETNDKNSLESKSDADKYLESSSSHFQEPKSVGRDDKQSSTETLTKIPGNTDLSISKEQIEGSTLIPEGKTSSKLMSPSVQSRPDSSSTPRSEPAKAEMGSPHFSPVSKPDSQVQTSPEVQPEVTKSGNSWNLGQFKTTPTHKSAEASPLNRVENQNKLRQSKMIEQCSPTTSMENKTSPESHNVKHDMKTTNSWNYGSYSPMPRQDNQFSSQRSPYSAQPSPAQPSPYSAQPSPYSTQPSPYSSQPSPYSAQPSPDTSQMVKNDAQKTNAWNSGNYSPMRKHHAPFSPHPSPEPGLGGKTSGSASRTPGQYSPMSRQDRMHQSPYSPRPSADKSGYSPMMRPDCHLPSPEAQASRSRTDHFGRSQNPRSAASDASTWPMSARFGQMSGSPSAVESLPWGSPFGEQQQQQLSAGVSEGVLSAPNAHHAWGSMQANAMHEEADPWALGQFRLEPPAPSFAPPAFPPHLPQSYLDESFPEATRLD